MKVKELTLIASKIPQKLRKIPQPVTQLFIRMQEDQSVNELFTRPCVAVVGSRKVSAYGKAVTAQLSAELAKRGIVIISGLALGVDSISHKAALEAGGLTVAVLPGPLTNIYPGAHWRLAQQIVARGGALVSEYQPGRQIYPGNFIERNRIVSGLCDALLVTEAAERSGTLHTARFALEQGREVLAVPGNITSPTSAGTNNLIKTGATPVTCVEDILHVLGLETGSQAATAPRGATPHEQTLLTLVFEGVADGAELLARSQLDPSLFNQTLTMLEIRGQIRPLGNNHWALQ